MLFLTEAKVPRQIKHKEHLQRQEKHLLAKRTGQKDHVRGRGRLFGIQKYACGAATELRNGAPNHDQNSSRTASITATSYQLKREQ